MSSKRIENLIEAVRPILAATSDAMCILNNDDEIVYTNSFYEKMIKRGSTELVADAKEVFDGQEKIAKVIVYHDNSEVNRLRRELDRLNQKLRKVETKYTFQDIIGEDTHLQEVIKTAKIVAMTPATIMIRGESGAGKEIFANAIHNSSPRRNERFVKINCSSIPEELLESELFGYKEGAFTGARRGGKRGLFQDANKGTLFLDEVGDVSPRMQVKLLRVLQEKEIMPVGSTEVIPVDVRIICATNKPLEEMIEKGEFREDLYYRLNVFPLVIPPLRERKEDIEAIVLYLMNQYNGFYERNAQNIDKDALQLLKNRYWEGNVRELENIISRILIGMDGTDQTVTKLDVEIALGDKEKIQKQKKAEMENIDATYSESQTLKEAMEKFEKAYIEEAIANNSNDKNKAAYKLDLPLRTLYYKCKKYGVK